jgi:C4-dicarboxylate transporter, DctQ subunit
MPTREKRWVVAIESVVMKISEISSWIYLFIGVIVAYEVLMRYFFNSPTAWVEETSRLAMVWATFCIFAACLSRRQLIAITLLSNALGERGKCALEAISYALIAVICAYVGWLSLQAMLEAVAVNRSTASVLRIPYWAFYLPVTLGFLLFFVQATLEFVVIATTGERRKTDLGHEEI